MQRSPLRNPYLLLALLLGLTVLILRIEGRVWWCACRQPTPFSSDVNSMHNSQHLFDPYSFSHLLHGVIFFFCLRLIAPRLMPAWRLLIATTIEASWEILENSPIIIERYRAATSSLGYSGDSIVNSVGDVISCTLGCLVARTVGWRWSLAIFVGIELIMLYAIKDNLTLNIIMLIYPIQAIKRWQMGG